MKMVDSTFGHVVFTSKPRYGQSENRFFLEFHLPSQTKFFVVLRYFVHSELTSSNVNSPQAPATSSFDGGALGRLVILRFHPTL